MEKLLVKLAILDNTKQAAIAIDAEGIIFYWNHEASTVFGWSNREVLGKSFLELIIPSAKGAEAIHKANLHQQWSESFLARNKQGHEFSLHFIGSPLYKEDGTIAGSLYLVGTLQAQMPHQMIYFLNKASQYLSKSLDLKDILNHISKLVVPELADWFVIEKKISDEKTEILILSHKEEEKIKWAYELRKKYPPQLDAKQGLWHVLRTGKSEYYPFITEEMLQYSAQSAKHFKIIQDVGFHSAMIIPIKIDEKILGVITFAATTDSMRQYSATDVQLAEEFAVQVGMALENNRLYMEAKDELAYRKEVQEKLKEKDALFEIIINSIPVHISYLDTNRRYKFVNNRYHEWYDREFVGRSVLEVVGKDVYNEIKPYLDKALDGQEAHFEIDVNQKQGDVRNFEGHYVPDIGVDGKVNGIVVLGIDVTESRQMRSSLSESEKRFETMAETAPVMIWITDVNGNCTYLNKGWANFTGNSVDDGVEDGWKKAIHMNDKDAFNQVFNEGLTSHKPFKMEYRLRRYDGNFRWILNTGVPRFAGDGSFKGFIGSCIDIDDQKKIIEKKDEFISIASHELKTPLTSIKGFLQLVEIQEKQALSEKGNFYIDKASQHVKILNELIDDLLDVSRINTGKLDFTMEELNYDHFIRDIIDLLQNSSRTHRLILKGKADAIVLGDRKRLKQVLLNFISNAIKYSPDKDKVVVKIGQENGHIWTSIQDFGIGIRKADHSKIFNRYFRVENTANEYSGLGIGLFITSEIIRNHKGKVWLDSSVGKGSTFHFNLPVKARIDH